MLRHGNTTACRCSTRNWPTFSVPPGGNDRYFPPLDFLHWFPSLFRHFTSPSYLIRGLGMGRSRAVTFPECSWRASSLLDVLPLYFANSFFCLSFLALSLDGLWTQLFFPICPRLHKYRFFRPRIVTSCCLLAWLLKQRKHSSHFPNSPLSGPRSV